MGLRLLSSTRSSLKLCTVVVCFQAKYLDRERRFQWLDGQAAFAFGKYKGFALAQTAAVDSRYMVNPIRFLTLQTSG